ncbi:MAG: hypothetical protein JO115_02430 [Pseudonocardiales bacterium]|nr:hypothetical protein [Pseudonocardiales bacterium]
MSLKRGDRAAPPRVDGEYDIRFDNSETERHHRLRGSLSTVSRRGADLEQWQFEVTGGGRIGYLIEEMTRTVWITYAGTGHPTATDR